MARGKELTPQLRSRLCALKAAGLSYRKIREHYPTVPLSTIKYTCLKEAQRDECRSLPKSGRPGKLTEDDRDRLREVIANNPCVKSTDLLVVVGNKIKQRAMRKLVREMKMNMKIKMK